MRRFHPANLRAAWWAVRTARRTRRRLDAGGLDAALAPPPPPPLPAAAQRGARAALYHWGETCLVNSIVLQAWDAAHGRERDLVIGITGPDRFHAHAWLEGDPLPTGDDIGIDASVLPREPGLRGASARRKTKPVGQAASGEGQNVRFQELLRRSAPQYPAYKSTQGR